jgi:uncharacterized membrane protein
LELAGLPLQMLRRPDGELFMTWRGTTTVSDRIFASLPYLLVLVHGLAFSASLLSIPALGTVLSPVLLPATVLQRVYYSNPFMGLIIFFALFLLVVRNERISHFIRFNTMQALLISIVLFLCELVIGGLSSLGGSVTFIVLVLNNAVFLAVLAAFGYAVVQSFRGRYAEIPTLSEAVYLQVR